MTSPPEPIRPEPGTAGDAAIFGLDNVRLELPLAGLGSRILAALVDYTLLALLVGLWWTGVLATQAFLELSEGWMWALLGLGTFLVQWSYFAALEILMEGQTPGKGLLGLRVVAHHGGRTSSGPLVMRNLIRAVDFFFGLPAMAVDRRFRRLGDMAAGTLVVHVETGAGETVLGNVPRSWGAREIAVVEGFLHRAEEMETARAERLAGRLIAWIEREEPGFEKPFAGEPAEAVAALRQWLQVSPPSPQGARQAEPAG